VEAAYVRILKRARRLVLLKRKQWQAKRLLVNMQSLLRKRAAVVGTAFEFDVSEPAPETELGPVSSAASEEEFESASGISEGSLFDGVIHLAQARGMELAVDPECLLSMSAEGFNSDALFAVQNADELSSMLRPDGYAVRKSPLGSGQSSVLMVTRPEIWAYSGACWYLRAEKPAKALAALSRKLDSESAFGRHCVRLRALLRKTENDNRDLEVLRKRISSAISACKVANLTGHLSLPKERAARDPLFKYRAKLRAAAPELLQAIETAYASRLLAEIDFLSFLVGSRNETLRDLAERAQAESVKLGDDFLDELPDAELKSELSAIARKRMDVPLKLAQKALAEENYRSAYTQYAKAMGDDRSDFKIRVGVAYCMTKRHTDSVRALLARPSPSDAKMVEVTDLFKRTRRLRLLATLGTVCGQPDTAASSGGRFGVARIEKIGPPVLDGLAMAAASDAVELAMVSPLFEGGLLAASVEDLCYVTLLLADGTPKNWGGSGPDIPLEVLATTRKGQIQVLLGKFEDATRTLESVAGSYPELYTARRLLELMSLHCK